MHKWSKNIVQWTCGDTLYLSVVFSWQLAEAERIAKAHKGRVVAGGPAIKLNPVDWAETPDTCPFDVLAMHNPCATFTSRGCDNKCGNCIVPKSEGRFRELDTWKPAPVICDNSLPGSKKHFERVIDSVQCFPEVDFNQGLQCRTFTAWHADQIARLRHAKVRFAFDHVNSETVVHDAIETARAAGLTDLGVYVLIGYEDTPADARYRLDKCREWNVLPNPMRYQPLKAKVKNGCIGPNWTEYELLKMSKYYNRLIHLGHIPYDEFIYRKDDQPLFAEAL